MGSRAKGEPMTVINKLPTKRVDENGVLGWIPDKVAVTGVSEPFWASRPEVLLTVHGKSVVVLAEDLKKAIENAINV